MVSLHEAYSASRDFQSDQGARRWPAAGHLEASHGRACHSLAVGTGFRQTPLRGYEHEVSTHTEVAAVIARGQADAGLGIQAAALAAGLDFLPLCQERYDLVMPMAFYEAPLLRPLLDELHSGSFHSQAQALGGYDTGPAGR